MISIFLGVASAVYYTDFYLSLGESLAMYRLRQVSSSPFSANKLRKHIPAKSEGLSLLILSHRLPQRLLGCFPTLVLVFIFVRA